jgi:hypothetical protein
MKELVERQIWRSKLNIKRERPLSLPISKRLRHVNPWIRQKLLFSYQLPSLCYDKQML